MIVKKFEFYDMGEHDYVYYIVYEDGSRKEVTKTQYENTKIQGDKTLKDEKYENIRWQKC